VRLSKLPQDETFVLGIKSFVEAGKERRGIKAISHRTKVEKPKGRPKLPVDTFWFFAVHRAQILLKRPSARKDLPHFKQARWISGNLTRISLYELRI